MSEAVFDDAVALLQIDDAGKKAATVAELEQLAGELAKGNDAADRLKFLTDELDNIEKAADRLHNAWDLRQEHRGLFSITLGSDACPADWTLKYESRTKSQSPCKPRARYPALNDREVWRRSRRCLAEGAAPGSTKARLRLASRPCLGRAFWPR